MYSLLRPLLFALPPETAHAVASGALRLARPFLKLGAPWLQREDPRLERRMLGLCFKNPIGLAAGFDKYALHLRDWPQLGFGFAEIGTITARRQLGNTPPRIWRYPGQQALINRFGFNNDGAELTASRLDALRQSGAWPAHPVGINLGKSKLTPLDGAADDYLFSLGLLRRYADYIAINVSSPNTPGLRSLQGSLAIKRLVRALRKECVGADGARLPLLVKFAPDLTLREINASVEAALSAGADGLILCNTTLSRQGLPSAAYPDGGLSGGPVGPMADLALERVAKLTRGRVPLIGVGGILTAADARRKLDLGAWLLQVYTGFIYQGPSFPAYLSNNLVEWMPPKQQVDK